MAGLRAGKHLPVKPGRPNGESGAVLLHPPKISCAVLIPKGREPLDLRPRSKRYRPSNFQHIFASI